MNQYLPPYYDGHLEEKPNLTEKGLVRILRAHFETLCADTCVFTGILGVPL